jgi:PAS domain S-box-containing protein
MDPIAHEQVIAQLAEHLRPLFESSPDGVYVWLDETHWTCSERFAELFGYRVADVENRPHFLQEFVHEDDREVFAWNYANRVHAQTFPVTFRFRGIHRDGSELQAETDMIPLTFGGHTIAYHFVRVVGR